jgi:bifunctional non-homologous end joining protein LigD
MGIRNEESPLLTYICKASLGLTQSDINLLKQYYSDLASEKCTFEPESLKNFEANGTRVTWINPLITCWVSFLELTNTGQLRHPKIIGFTSLPPEEANGRILERNG